MNPAFETTLAKIRGCLIGGAVGDALGAPIEFSSLEEIRERFGPEGLADYSPAYGAIGSITDDTQMTLFTAEGITRAYMRMRSRGICNSTAIVAHAYQRWLHTQGERSGRPERVLQSGWLVHVPELQHRRAPGDTCIKALRTGAVKALNSSKGCGGVMRVAPIGLFLHMGHGEVFRKGCESAAITHGHPTGYLTAGVLAELIAGIVREGLSVEEALQRAMRYLDHEPDDVVETRRALEAARWLARRDGGVTPSPAVVESLGGGWVAEEALAIGVYCAMVAGDFPTGVLLAANHSGDSDSTASIAGSILGALLGPDAIPRRWIEQLEVRDTLDRLCDDWEQLFTRKDIFKDGWSITGDWGVRYPPN